MELKRILAKDARTATEQAIKLYGDHVLIVSNHRVGTQTELVLAVDIAAENAPLHAAHISPGVQAAEPQNPFKQQFATLMGMSEPRAAQPKAVELAAAAQEGQPAQAEVQAEDDRDRIRSQEIVSLVREELADLRREFRQSQRTALWQANASWDDNIQPLVSLLHSSTMPTGLRTLLLDGLQNQTNLALASAQIRSQLLSAAANPDPLIPQKGVHVIAGPSGAGKSLMAARLAQAGATQLGAEQVALISFHDMRAGAWSQVQILGAQAGVEVFRAVDTATLQLLMSELSHRQLIVIDTPGVQMASHVQDIMTVSPSAWVHAVVAADASETTWRRVLHTESLRFDSLMVSKMDEADAPWALLQFLSNGLPVPARSLVSQSDRLAQPLQTWSVQSLVDHAMVADQLVFSEADVSPTAHPLVNGFKQRELNG